MDTIGKSICKYGQKLASDPYAWGNFQGQAEVFVASFFVGGEIGDVSKVGDVFDAEKTLDVAAKIDTDIMVGTGNAALPSEAELNNAVSEWSRMQKSLASSKTQAAKFNTGTVVYDSRTGQYYYGMNRGVGQC